MESQALVDTGSQISIVNKEMIQYLTDFKREPISLRAVNQRALHVLGTGNLLFHMAGLDFEIQVIAVSSVNQALLLGLDFLTRFVKSINMQDRSIEFLDEFKVLPNFVIGRDNLMPPKGKASHKFNSQEQEPVQHDCGSIMEPNSGNFMNIQDRVNSDLVRETIAEFIPAINAVEVQIEDSFTEDRPPIAIASVELGDDNLDVCLTACPVDDSVVLKVSLGDSSKYPQVFIRPEAILADSHMVFDYTHIQTKDQECDVYAVELGQTDLQLDLADIEDIPNIPTKKLPENWENLPNIVPEVLTVLENYNSVLQTSSDITLLPKVRIETGCSFPRWSQPYTTTEHKRAIIKQQCKDWLDAGIIEKSLSPWASPVVLVTQKSVQGTLKHRLCGNFKRLNECVVRQNFPMPRAEELMDGMRNSRVFSVIDLKSAYLQLPLSAADKEKTAIITSDGHYHFNFLPFGVSIASQTMQRTMHHLFDDLLEKFLKIFYDDLAVHSANPAEHVVHLGEVLYRLAKAGLVIAIEKCQFFKLEIKYLGHILSAEGIAADPGNVKAVMDWDSPKNIKQVKQFLGAVAYYRRFIKDFSERSKALRHLLAKNIAWRWDASQEEAFQDLRLALASEPVLVYFDPDKETYLKSDASLYALGAVLTQLHNSHERVVAYASQALTPQQQKWGVPQQECYAVVWAVKRFQKYLDGIQFTLFTDHHALCSLFAIKDPQGKLARWAVIIQGFDFQIRFKEGSCNADADCLSRLPTLLSQSVNFVELQDLIEGQQKAITQGEIVLTDTICQHPESKEIFYDFGELKPLYVPAELRNKLLQTVHGDALMGHMGAHKVLAKLRSKYKWPGMCSDVTNFIKRCTVCQFFNKPNKKAAGLLQSLPVSQIFHTLALDFVGGFAPTVNANKYILVAIDLFSKYIVAVPTPNMSAEVVADFLLFQIGLRYGFPERLLSDRDPAFLSAAIQQLLALASSKKVNTSSYHPQCDGQAESAVKQVTRLLSKFVANNPFNWDILLPFVSFQYNTTTQDSIRVAPFTVVFGATPRIISLPEPAFSGRRTVSLVMEHCIAGFSTVRTLVARFLESAREKQQFYYNSRHADVQFRVGDRVLFRDVSVRPAGSKLKPRYRGPFVVAHKINPVSYILENPESHVTFSAHVSKLKEYFEPIAEEKEVINSQPVLPAELFPVSIQWEDDSSEDGDEPDRVTPVRLRNNFGDWQIVAPLLDSSQSSVFSNVPHSDGSFTASSPIPTSLTSSWSSFSSSDLSSPTAPAPLVQRRGKRERRPPDRYQDNFF